MEKQINTEKQMENFSSRPFKPEDAQVLAGLYNAYSEAALGISDTTVDEILQHMTSPDMDLERSSLIVFEKTGKCVAGMWIFCNPDKPVHPALWGAVHPEFEGQGLGTFLLKWVEERTRENLVLLPEDVRCSILVQIASGHLPSERLLTNRQYQLIRQTYQMQINFEQSPEKPQPPEGFIFHALNVERDLRKVYVAIQEAFKDHFGYVPIDEENGFAGFKHRNLTDKAFDPDLWLIAKEGEEVVGVLIGRGESHSNPEHAYIPTLGVRRPWRGRGLASYMLMWFFHQAYLRGKNSAVLHVDASSLTGALRVYEKAGMRAVECFDLYEKEIRPGRELATINLDGQ